MMHKINAVIFDMDGVLVNSELIHKQAESAILEKYHISIDESDWMSFKGRTAVAIFTSIINKYKLKDLDPVVLAEEKNSLYLRLAAQNLVLFDGALDLLNYLKPHYQLALTTSSVKPILDLLFDRYQLYPFFTVMVTGDMVTHGKPHPEPYTLTMQKLGVSPDRCLVIEDSESGVLSAKAAGALTVAVTSTLSREKLGAADYVVDNLRKIQELFERDLHFHRA